MSLPENSIVTTTSTETGQSLNFDPIFRDYKRNNFVSDLTLVKLGLGYLSSNVFIPERSPMFASFNFLEESPGKKIDEYFRSESLEIKISDTVHAPGASIRGQSLPFVQ